MKKFARTSIGILISSAGFVTSSFAQTTDQDALVFSAGLQHLYDSNFFRSPEEIEEQITRAGAGVRYNKQFSAQHISLGLSGSRYRYAEQDDLDSSTIEGQASWRSQFTSNVSTKLDWDRDETPVDKLEFVGKDLVAKEDANARLSFGDSKRIGVILGAHQLDMKHSSVERRELDFQDSDFFSEIRYRMASGSWLGLRYREGEREYELINPTQGNLDFDYRQLELETEWALTTKTSLTGLVGYFDRTAKPDALIANDGEGTLASLKMEWAISEKLATDLTYRYNEPAVGETSDAPSEVSDSSILLRWQFSPKVQVGFGASYAELYYQERALMMERTERNITVMPLQISWAYSEASTLRLTSSWMDRSSPVFERDYKGYSAGLALAFHF